MLDGEAKVAIVGAGPIGLELALALKRQEVDYLHFDAKQIGHTMSWWAPQTRFFSSNERIAIDDVPLVTPDQTKATREQYLAYLRGVVQQFDLQVNTYEPVSAIERNSDGFILTTRPASGERRWRVDKLILATGGTDHPRRLNVPGEDLPHVSHYFREPHHYFRRKVLIVGGKNSAVEAALRCREVGAQVAISYRRSELPKRNIKYWLMPEIHGLIESGRIPFHASTIIRKITPGTVTLGQCDSDFKPCGTESTEVEADEVLALIGYEQDTTLFEKAGIPLHGSHKSPLFDPETMETPIPGLYVAGTAVGGTQDKYTVFIENCHVHVSRIVSHLTGRKIAVQDVEFSRPES